MAVLLGTIVDDNGVVSNITRNVPDRAVIAPPSGYTQTVYFDHFDGADVDSTKWLKRNNYHAGNESANRWAANVSQANSCLILQPKIETTTTTDGTTRQLSSGEIYSDGKFSVQRPFRWDTVASLPHIPEMSSVMWPALWCRAVTGTGEIDLMEAWGTPVTNLAHSTGSDDPHGRFASHAMPDTNTTAGKIGNWTIPLGTDLVAWHKYSLIVASDGSIQFLFDDVVKLSYAASANAFLANNFAGGYTFRITLQLGQPSWYGAPDLTHFDTTQAFKVDWTGIYKP